MKKLFVVLSIVIMSTAAVANPFSKVQFSKEFLSSLLSTQPTASQIRISIDPSNPFSKVQFSRNFIEGLVQYAPENSVIEIDISNPFSEVRFSDSFLKH